MGIFYIIHYHRITIHFEIVSGEIVSGECDDVRVLSGN